MKCKQYIFNLTSGQLAEARWPLRASAYLHHLVCSNCQRFTANDHLLTEILDARKTHASNTPHSPQALRANSVDAPSAEE